jgi:hypothetical protein
MENFPFRDQPTLNEIIWVFALLAIVFYLLSLVFE